jgi:hypothetical protein
MDTNIRAGGQHGILPAQSLDVADEAASHGGQVGLDRYHILPTLAWISATDASLNFWCGAGTVLAILLLLGCALPCAFSSFG